MLDVKLRMRACFHPQARHVLALTSALRDNIRTPTEDHDLVSNIVEHWLQSISKMQVPKELSRFAAIDGSGVRQAFEDEEG